MLWMAWQTLDNWKSHATDPCSQAYHLLFWQQACYSFSHCWLCNKAANGFQEHVLSRGHYSCVYHAFGQGSHSRSGAGLAGAHDISRPQIAWARHPDGFYLYFNTVACQYGRHDPRTPTASAPSHAQGTPGIHSFRPSTSRAATSSQPQASTTVVSPAQYIDAIPTQLGEIMTRWNATGIDSAISSELAGTLSKTHVSIRQARPYGTIP